MARAAAVKVAATAAASAARRRRGPLLLTPAMNSAAAAAAVSTSSSSSHSRASAPSTSGGGWFSALFGGSSRPRGHRPFNENEERHVRLATRKKDKVLSANPGARVEPGFVSPAEGEAAAADAFEILKRYGISHVTDEQRAFMAGQMKHVPLPKEELAGLVNMKRVTGRFESEEQKLAPWGYGDEFDVAQVPPGLRHVLEQIQSSDAFCLGKPRDITINYRTHYYYRLDPHVDPVKDGGNVFILGLLSGTVLTLTPPSKTMSAAQFTHMDQRRVSEQSWQPGKDVDVDLVEGALLHLSGEARSHWGHGIRLGVTANQIQDFHFDGPLPPEVEAVEGEADLADRRTVPLYDWWGSMHQIRRRRPERLSIIFAFDDPL